jgi:magnesium transporter
LAVEDAIKAHQRPRVERYDETLFVVLNPARCLDKSETVEFSEVHRLRG